MIKIEGISKRFKLYRSPADRLREILFRKPYHKDFVALDNISFKIGAGQTLGIIGQNGAGKSTLLKILSGIVIPDSGTIHIDGKVTGLLELGTGFNYEMTGLENIYMNGTLIGMTKDEIDRKKQTIIDFSELGEFISEPIKTYSSGMTMRLAFSIAIHADPKCFLVDEALAVGDAYFQQKCMRKIQEFRASGGSIVFVSHDMNAIKTLCDVAILIDHGQTLLYGTPKEVVDFYISMILKKSHMGDAEVKYRKLPEDRSNSKQNDTINEYGIATDEVELISFKILDSDHNEIFYCVTDDIIIFELAILSYKDLENPHYGISIRNKLGLEIFGTSTYVLGVNDIVHKKNTVKKIRFMLKIPFQPDKYSITIGVANKGYPDGRFDEYLLYMHDVVILTVNKNYQLPVFAGMVIINTEISISENNGEKWENRKNSFPVT